MLLKDFIMQNENIYPSGGITVSCIHLHPNRFSRSSSIALRKHESKCNLHFNIHVFLRDNTDQHYLLSFDATFSFITLQKKTNVLQN